MVAGLPGTGIGGLFYILLVLQMPFRECWMTVTGRGSLVRWRDVGRHVALAASIVGALWIEAMVLIWILARVKSQVAGSWLESKIVSATAAVPPGIGWSPVVLLTGIIILVHILRVMNRRRTGGSSGLPACRPDLDQSCDREEEKAEQG